MIAVPPSHARVLVADNSVSSRGVLSILLESAGYDVILVGDGAHAVDALRAHAFDLAILDHEMPNLDDFGALVELRSAVPGLPVIICAESLAAEDAARYRELGVVELLIKPVDPHALRDKVTSILQRPSPQPAPVSGASMPPFLRLHPDGESPGPCPLASGPSRFAKKLHTDLQRLRDFRSVAILEGPLGSGRFELAMSLAPAAHAHVFVCHADEFTTDHLARLFKPAGTTQQPVFLVILEADRLDAGRQAYLEDVLSGRVVDHATFGKRLRVALCAQRSLCDLHFNELLLMRGVTATLRIPDFVERWMDWADIARAILRRAGSGRTTFDPEAIRWINRHKWTGDYMQLHRTVEIARRHAGLSPVVTDAHLAHAASAEPACNDPLFHDLLFHVHSGG
jgi:DNA-binding NtrC family response regulator